MTDKPAPQPAPLKDRLRMMGKCPPHMAREAGAEIERLENEVAVLREQRDDLFMALGGLLGRGATGDLFSKRINAARIAWLKACK